MPEPFTPPKVAKVSNSPQINKEPPKEVLAQTFTMDPSLVREAPTDRVLVEDKAGKETPVKVVESQHEAEKKVAEVKEVKVESKVEEKKEASKEVVAEDKKSTILKPPAGKEGEKKEVIAQIVPPVKDNKARDYSGFSAQEQEALKQMSNPAFDFASKLIKDNKELSKSKDSFVLQHPDAYTLTPEYKTSVDKIERSKIEANYYLQCLKLMDEGKSFRPAVGWNDKGELLVGNEIPPTLEEQEKARSFMNNCRTIQMQEQQKAAGMSQQFQSEVKQTTALINQERAKRFQWVEKPELLDYTITTEAGEKSIKQIRDDFASIFPPYLHNNPIMEVGADLMVSLVLAKAELAQALNGKQVAEVKQAEVQRGEPTSVVKPAQQGEAINGVREFSLAGMPSS